MATEKLYWNDAFATTFEAESARAATWQGRPSLVLERTLFYPEAGGQLADLGTLEIGGRSIAIEDVQVDDEGVIHHVVAAAPEDLTGAVRGVVDRNRRRDQMSQHTAQHALSRALMDVAKAETVSARLGATSCTIDVHLSTVPERELARAEDLVNAVVMDDVPIRALFPSEQELAAMPLRRTPKVTTNIRVIEIDGFDFTPCGGTHCARSGQIGPVRIAGTERYKGMLRVSFHAGRRMIDDARVKEAVLQSLAQDFTCGLLDVPSAVAKLRAELKSRTDQLAGLRGELADRVVEAALASFPPDPSGTTVVPLTRPRDDLATLRSLAGRLAARPDVVAVCATLDAESGEVAVVLQRGESASFDCGAWLKSTAAAHGGRGGGRPERAEGRLRLASLEDVETLARSARGA